MKIVITPDMEGESPEHGLTIEHAHAFVLRGVASAIGVVGAGDRTFMRCHGGDLWGLFGHAAVLEEYVRGLASEAQAKIDETHCGACGQKIVKGETHKCPAP